jgi:hypothetical protein
MDALDDFEPVMLRDREPLVEADATAVPDRRDPDGETLTDALEENVLLAEPDWLMVRL